jgi:ParB/RepB/Spo0J family partition protein
MLVELRRIAVPEENLRLHMGDVRELARMIAARGLLQPLLVRQLRADRYALVAGHRRRAALELVRDEPDAFDVVVPELRARPMRVPVYVLTVSELERRFANLAENGGRRDLSQWEFGRACEKLLEEHTELTQAELARQIGVARSTVCNAIRCVACIAPDIAAELDGEIERRDRRVSAALLLHLASLPSADEQRGAWRAALGRTVASRQRSGVSLPRRGCRCLERLRAEMAAGLSTEVLAEVEPFLRRLEAG